MNIAESFTGIGDRLARAREELRIVEEQMLWALDVVEDARARMLASETPLAERNFRVARDDYDRLARQRARLGAEIAELHGDQDRLLDRMLAARP
jgi:hypothetical protein